MNLNKPKSKRVFQAGLSDGLNGWIACGRGSSLELARYNLSETLNLLSINDAINHFKKFASPELNTIKTYIEQRREFYDTYRYVETSYIETHGEL